MIFIRLQIYVFLFLSFPLSLLSFISFEEILKILTKWFFTGAPNFEYNIIDLGEGNSYESSNLRNNPGTMLFYERTIQDF